MILQPLVSGLLALAAAPPGPSGSDLLALRVGRAETVSGGTLEHAVVLVEDGKIVAIGEDLPIERGIPILERPEWVVTPGLVNCHSRMGMDGRAGRDFEPQVDASGELLAGQDVYEDLLEAGVTTLALYPPGTGIPGQAVTVRPKGDTADEMIVAKGAYLLIHLQSSEASKKMLRDAFEKLDEYDEKVAKAREKWEKELEKQKKKKKSSKSKSKKDDDEKKDDEDGDKEADEKDAVPEVFTPPEPDEKVKPFLDLREGRLTAMVSIRKAADYLHLLDVIEDEDPFPWFLHAPLRDDIDYYEVAERIGERELRIVMNAEVTLQPGSRRERNLPAEMARAGAKLALLPENDTLRSHEEWMHDVGRLIASGLDRDAALAAVTLEAARALGLDERLGSLEEGKDANMVFWNGDPFEPSTRIEAVMLEGRFVVGEVGP